MHSIKNISERNKIDTQSRTDAYGILVISDYNSKPKSILESEKILKILSSGKVFKKNQKTTGLG
jgi:hypothetical protein